MPASTVDGMGTPRTGTSVQAASMPGRCAAPPAPATMTSRPRDSAPFAYSIIHSGVRCAETIRASKGMASSSSTARVSSITARSLRLPMTTPTMGGTLSAVLNAPPRRDLRPRLDPCMMMTSVS
jgi:hypothetical protein